MRTDAAGPRTWLLGALAGWCALAWVLALVGMGGQVTPLPDDPALVQALPTPPPAAQERLGPLVQYGEISARPIFSNTRRPQPFFISGNGEEEARPFDLVLSSVLITPGLRMAILQPAQGGESVRLKVGESPASMPGWQLVDVQPRQALFDGPEGARTLELRVFDGTGGQAPTAMASPPVAPPLAGPSRPRPATAPPEGPAAAAAGATPSGRPVPSPDAADSGMAGASEEPALTTEAQMDAIRKRIEARRAQIRAAEKGQPPQNQTQ